MTQTHTYEKATVKDLPHAEVEIEVVISAELLDQYKNSALDALAETVEIDGFRKGKAPRDVVEKHAGDDVLLKEASERAIQATYPEILKDKNIDAIGYPHITIKKLAWGNPLEVIIKTATVPDVTLPDYKKIAETHQEKAKKETKTHEATDEEVDNVLVELRKGKAHSDWHKANPDQKDEHDHPDFSKEENLPPLNDAFAQAMGQFNNMDELTEQIKKNVIREKEMKEAEKHRIALFDELADKTKAEIPEILIEGELAKMIGGLKDDVTKAGLTFEDYLKEIKKTEEDIKKEWRSGAEKRAKMQLIFNTIAEKEHITADPDIVENEVKKLLEMYKDADKERARVYVETSLINDQVVKMLEGNQK